MIAGLLDGGPTRAPNPAAPKGPSHVKLERWVIISFVICIFGALGVLGWHFTQPRADRICASAAAQCADRPYLGAP